MHRVFNVRLVSFSGILLLSGLNPMVAQAQQVFAAPCSVSQNSPSKDAYIPIEIKGIKTGKIAYCGQIEESSDDTSTISQQYVVVRDLGSDSVQTLNLSLYKPLKAFAPQISPDGKNVLFKVGDTDNTEQSNYFFYVWELGTGKVIKGPSILLHENELKWSDNGSIISYYRTSEAKPVPNGSKEIQTKAEVDLYNFNLKTLAGERIQQGALPGQAWLSLNRQVFTNEATTIGPKGSKDAGKPIKTLNIFQKSPSGPITSLIPNATSPQLSPDKNFILFRQIVPFSAEGILTVRDLRDEKKSVVLPTKYQSNNSLQIQLLSGGKILVVEKPMANTIKLDIFNPFERPEPGKAISHQVIPIRKDNKVSAPYNPQFKVSPQLNPATLITRIRTFGATQENGLIDSYVTLRHVNVLTKVETDFAEFKNANGVDSWHVKTGASN